MNEHLHGALYKLLRALWELTIAKIDFYGPTAVFTDRGPGAVLLPTLFIIIIIFTVKSSVTPRCLRLLQRLLDSCMCSFQYHTRTCSLTLYYAVVRDVIIVFVVFTGTKLPPLAHTQPLTRNVQHLNSEYNVSFPILGCPWKTESEYTTIHTDSIHTRTCQSCYNSAQQLLQQTVMGLLVPFQSWLSFKCTYNQIWWYHVSSSIQLSYKTVMYKALINSSNLKYLQQNKREKD